MAIVTAITSVFSAIGDWLVEALGDLGTVFYVTGTGADAGLTFIGTLAVIGLGIGVIFLVMGVIQNFLRMRS